MQRNRDGGPSWSNRFGRFNLFLGLIAIAGSGTAYAESFEEYKRSQMESFGKYKEERDREFREYLTKEWKAYRLSQGMQAYEAPKPKTIPKAKKVQSEPVGPKVVIALPKPEEKKPEPATSPDIATTPEAIKPPAAVDPDAVTVELFGTSVVFTAPQTIRKARFAPADQSGIAAFFDVLATGDYTGMMEDFRSYQARLSLNDWAMYRLVKAGAQSLYGPGDEAVLFSWFVMSKLGYSTKIALDGNTPVLLLHSEKTIYATPHFSFGKRRYYAVDYYAKKGLGSLRTYKHRYPDADKVFDLALASLPHLDEQPRTKRLQFRYRGEKIELAVAYDQNLVDFMQTYPQADYATYFNAPLSKHGRESLVRQLKPLLDGKQASTALNMLLFFVQNAFDYQRDDEQFGREKVMFAEETLYYSASDCEDRAVLFSYLVKELFGVDVVGLKYKDHMATAIALPIKGDALSLGKRRYVIADPTYINAAVGQSMPKYRNIIPDSYIPVAK